MVSVYFLPKTLWKLSGFFVWTVGGLPVFHFLEKNIFFFNAEKSRIDTSAAENTEDSYTSDASPF